MEHCPELNRVDPKNSEPPFPSWLFSRQTTCVHPQVLFQRASLYPQVRETPLAVKPLYDFHLNRENLEEMTTQRKNFKDMKDQSYFHIILVSKYSSYHKLQWNTCHSPLLMHEYTHSRLYIQNQGQQMENGFIVCSCILWLETAPWEFVTEEKPRPLRLHCPHPFKVQPPSLRTIGLDLAGESICSPQLETNAGD